MVEACAGSTAGVDCPASWGVVRCAGGSDQSIFDEAIGEILWQAGGGAAVFCPFVSNTPARFLWHLGGRRSFIRPGVFPSRGAAFRRIAVARAARRPLRVGNASSGPA